MTGSTRRLAGLDERPLPFAVVRESALDHNIGLMASWCQEHDVVLAPHVKTTMSPEIVERQLAAGAWGVTVATASQAEAVHDMGAPRTIVASEVADAASIRTLAQLHTVPDRWVMFFVDSVAGVELADRVLDASGVVMPVLVEIGATGGRAGVRSVDEAATVAAAVDRASSLILAGIGGFEGTLGADRTPATFRKVADYAGTIVAAMSAVAGSIGVDEPIVTVGGSAYFDSIVHALADGGARTVWATPTTIVTRSGCYVTHDCGVYDELSPFGSTAGSGGSDAMLQPALEVWGAVLSRPEPLLAIVGVGRRDVSFDAGMPVARAIRRRGTRTPAAGLNVRALNDQHAYVDLANEHLLAVGDVVEFGISHPCTTFDKWRELVLIDEEEVVVGAIRTRF